MNITFHGAARVVTGSKHLIALNNGTKILLDCGMFQGNPKEADALNREFGFTPSEVTYLILSHAHIDHCGLIPKLVKEGFKGPIFCTSATYELSKILLLDSAHIQNADIAYHNKKRAQRGESVLEPLYTVDDVNNALPQFQKVEYHQVTSLNDKCKFVYTDAGHIIGSAVVHVTIEEDGKTTNITFSGDVGRYNEELLHDPETFPQADYVLLESTYGDSLHADSTLNDQILLEIIVDTCLKKKGKLVIPAFSVGRSQELIYALNRIEVSKHLPPLEYYVDSPLSVSATEIVKKFQDELNDKFQAFRKIDPEPFDFDGLHYITDVADSKALNASPQPCVIISASGMADAGRVKHHIKHVISDHRNTILLVGYCEPNSLGGKLMRGATEVTIFGEPFTVRAEIKSLRSLSAHGDYEDLIRFIGCQAPDKLKKLFLVHGEYPVQQTFRSKLMAKGYMNIEIPPMHQTYPL